MKENNETNSILLESFNELGINYNNGEKALLDIENGDQTIDKKRNEVKLYFEYLMKNSGKTKDDIKEVLEVQNKGREEIITALYYIAEVFILDKISLNIWEDYLSRKTESIKITNLNTGEAITLINIFDENYKQLDTLHSMFMNAEEAKFGVSTLNDNGKNHDLTYLMGSNRTLN